MPSGPRIGLDSMVIASGSGVSTREYDVIFAEDNFLHWESFLRNSWLSREEAARLEAHMLNDWYFLHDMYAGYMIRAGIRTAKCVPSAEVTSPVVTRHRLGHDIIRIPVGTTTSSFQRALNFNARIMRTFKKRHPRILHYNTYYSSYFVQSWINKLSSKVIAQYSGGEPSSEASFQQRFQYLVPVRIGLHNSAGILISDFSADERRQKAILTRYYKLSPRRMIDFPVIVVDRSFFHEMDRQASARKLGFDPEDLNILVVSGMRQGSGAKGLAKNPFLVLRIFIQLAKISQVPWHLHFAGFGPAFLEFKSEVERNDLSKRVTLHGLVDHERLPLFYAASDATIYPYPELELKTGTAISESLCCRRPAIAFKRFPSLDVDQEGGFLIDQDVEEAAEQLSGILADRDGLARKGREGDAVAERYDLENVGRRLLEIYRELSG